MPLAPRHLLSRLVLELLTNVQRWNNRAWSRLATATTRMWETPPWSLGPATPASMVGRDGNQRGVGTALKQYMTSKKKRLICERGADKIKHVCVCGGGGELRHGHVGNWCDFCSSPPYPQAHTPTVYFILEFSIQCLPPSCPHPLFFFIRALATNSSLILHREVVQSCKAN